MNNLTNVGEIFTPERKAVLRDILLASGSTSITIKVAKPHPSKPEDILKIPGVDDLLISASFATP